MKRNELIRYLNAQGCLFVREGARHSWWTNPKLNKYTSIPRHTEINDLLAKKICKDLGVTFIKEHQ